MVVLVVFSVWAYIALTGEPRLQVGIANGRYSNGCCGTMVLKNGLMTVANQRVGYVVEQDKEGPYVLPNAYVGASDYGFVMIFAAIGAGMDQKRLHPDVLNRTDVSATVPGHKVVVQHQKGEAGPRGNHYVIEISGPRIAGRWPFRSGELEILAREAHAPDPRG